MAETELTGSVALVTGASSGIGEATAESLAAPRRQGGARGPPGGPARGALAAGSRTPAARRWSSRPTSPAARRPRRPWQRTVDELGGLDIVINNAGVMLLGPMADAPIEEWERMVQLNVMGALYVAKAALPHLLECAEHGPRGVADLVNISSVAGRVVRSGSGVYNATQARRRRVQRGAAPGVHRAAGCASRWSSPARPRPSWPATTARRCRSGCASGSAA